MPFQVTYDIGNPRRWRRVFKTMHGYGDWLQLLPVFQFRLFPRRRTELEMRLRELVRARGGRGDRRGSGGRRGGPYATVRARCAPG